MKTRWIKPVLPKLKIIFLVVCVFLIAVGISNARGKKGEYKLPSHYPDGFDGTGCLMKIYKNRVVIDDSNKLLSPELTYHTPDGNNMPVEYITQNSLVGYMVNSSNQVISIWLVKEKCDNQF